MAGMSEVTGHCQKDCEEVVFIGQTPRKSLKCFSFSATLFLLPAAVKTRNLVDRDQAEEGSHSGWVAIICLLCYKIYASCSGHLQN